MGTKIRPINLHTSVDTHIQGLIDSSFVQARSSGGTDSASTQAMIDSNFENTATFGNDVIFDSSGVMAFDKSEKLLKLGDASNLILGDDNDLRVFHSAGSGVIRNQTAGRIYLQSNNTTDGVIITKELAAETMAKFRADGPVELYHNNVKKLETTAYGATVTGTINADSATINNDIRVSGSVFIAGAGGTGATLNNTTITGVNYLEFNDPGNQEGIRWNGGNTQLFEAPNDLSNAAGNLQMTHGGTRRVSVSDSGAEVVGNLTVNDKMQIRPNATSSEIYEIAIDSANTGSFTGLNFKMDNNLIQSFSTGGSGQLVQFHKDVYLENGTKLYFDGSTDDANHTQLTVQNPTADRTITLPNMTGGIKELLISEGSMNASSLVFNSGTITTEYSELRLVLSNCKPSTQTGVYMRVGSSNSGDGGTNYGQAIYYSGYYGSASAYSINYVDHDATYFIIAEGYAQLGTGTGQNGHFEITFLNPNTSSHYKLFKINSQIYSYYPMLMGRYIDAAVWRSTAAINYIQVYPGSGNLALEYKLYGVKS
tara:strand:- start:1910 stop:3526 length:1617 start_codon:yes stop_codon:yes gene_type:complete